MHLLLTHSVSCLALLVNKIVQFYSLTRRYMYIKGHKNPSWTHINYNECSKIPIIASRPTLRVGIKKKHNFVYNFSYFSWLLVVVGHKELTGYSVQTGHEIWYPAWSRMALQISGRISSHRRYPVCQVWGRTLTLIAGRIPNILTCIQP